MVSLLSVLYSCSPAKSHPSPVGCQSGTNRVFGAGESLAVGHRTGSGCISSPSLRAALDNVHIKKRNVFSHLVILQNTSHLTAFRADCLEHFEALGTDYSHWLRFASKFLNGDRKPFI